MRRKQPMKEHIEKNGIEKSRMWMKSWIISAQRTSRLPLQQQRIPECTNSISHRLVSTIKFDQLVSATTVENGKPEPDVYLYACGADWGETKGLHCGGRFAKWNLICIPRISVVMVPDLAEPDEETAKLLYAKIDTLAGLKTII